MVRVDLVREGLVVEAEVEAVHAREEEGSRVLVEARVQVLRSDVVAAAGDEREGLKQRLDGVLGLELLEHEGGEGGEVDRDEVVAAVLGGELGELLLLLLRGELEVEVFEHLVRVEVGVGVEVEVGVRVGVGVRVRGRVGVAVGVRGTGRGRSRGSIRVRVRGRRS